MAKASRANDRGAIDFWCLGRGAIGVIVDIGPISAEMNGVFIADIRVQNGLRSEIPVISPI